MHVCDWGEIVLHWFHEDCGANTNGPGISRFYQRVITTQTEPITHELRNTAEGDGERGFSFTPRHELCSLSFQTCSCVSCENAFHRQSKFSQHVLLPLSATHQEREREIERRKQQGRISQQKLLAPPVIEKKRKLDFPKEFILCGTWWI